MIVISSLLHCGNTFTHQFLEGLGVYTIVRHIDPGSIRKILQLEPEVVVMPQRDPKKVIESLMKRGWDEPVAVQFIKDCAPLVLWIMKEFKCILVRIDGNLEAEMRNLCKELGRPYPEGHPLTPVNENDAVAESLYYGRVSQMRSYWNYG